MCTNSVRSNFRSIFFAFVSLFTLIVSSSVVPSFAEPTADASEYSVQAEVNINTASSQQLAAALTGIGAKKADAIVSYRNEHGKYTSVDQLLAVKGIGEATLNKNRSRIVL